jgi:hypothetical protein
VGFTFCTTSSTGCSASVPKGTNLTFKYSTYRDVSVYVLLLLTAFVVVVLILLSDCETPAVLEFRRN